MPRVSLPRSNPPTRVGTDRATTEGAPHVPLSVGIGPLAGVADPARRDLQTLQDVIAGRVPVHEGLHRINMSGGFPIVVDGTTYFVGELEGPRSVAGDFNGWQPEEMPVQGPLRVLQVQGEVKGRYKLVDDRGVWRSDPWSRAYAYDDHGELSLSRPRGAHLERFSALSGFGLPPRTVRVWVPAQKPTHHLYVQDGQNLFDPGAMWGGWRLNEAVGPRTMIIGIDNVGGGRFDEYTHTRDRVGDEMTGGRADAYADFVVSTVRGHIERTYGAPRKVGILGSSLGGLVAFHAAARHPKSFDFVGAMSGTFGWGKLGEGVANETMIDRYRALGRMNRPKFYVDSGGERGGADNYDAVREMADVLAESGYRWKKDLWHWHERGAPHRESAWAARVFRPVRIFESL